MSWSKSINYREHTVTVHFELNISLRYAVLINNIKVGVMYICMHTKVHIRCEAQRDHIIYTHVHNYLLYNAVI